MTRTQIQLPDELYRRAKDMAKAREISLAEMVRNGLEHVLSSMAPLESGRTVETLPVLEAPPELGDDEYPEWEADRAWATAAEPAAGRRGRK